MAFYDKPNLFIDLPESLKQICTDMIGKPFDHEKMQAVAISLLALRARKLSIRIWIFSHREPQFVERVADAARHVFGDDFSIEFGDVATFLSKVGAPYDLFIVGLGDELSRLAIFDRAIDHMADDSFLLIDSLSDVFRVDATISKEIQIARLEDKGFDILQSTYYCLASRGFRYFGLSSAKPQPIETEIQRNSVFIFGCQRSGTSLLVQILNSRPDVFVSYEANWHIEKNRSSLVANFNRLAEKTSKPLAKGSRLPLTADPDLSLSDLFRTLLGHYRLVGDKLAFGPRPAAFERAHAHRAMHFLETTFPLARLILTVRDPFTNCLAMCKINRGRNLAFMIDNWLTGMTTTIRSLATNDLSVLCSHEQLCRRVIRPVEVVTGLDFSSAVELIDPAAVTSGSREASDFFADAKPEYRAILGEASEVYRKLLNSVSEDGRPADRIQAAALQTCFADFSRLTDRFQSVADW